jgi:hypothetical protein
VAPLKETWNAVNLALYHGRRGLPAGDSLSRLLDRHRRAKPEGSPRRRARPWTPPEDDLVRALPAKEAAWRTGRTLGAVHERRSVLGVADGRRR